LQLDAAAPVLATLNKPIVIAKVDADKHTRLGKKYDVRYVSAAQELYGLMELTLFLNNYDI